VITVHPRPQGRYEFKAFDVETKALIAWGTYDDAETALARAWYRFPQYPALIYTRKAGA